jgi:hypothetical protein
VGLGLLHRGEVRLDRFGVELLGGRFIEECAVDRGDLRLVRLQVLVGGPPVENGPHARLGEIAQQVERTPARLVGRDLRRRGPLAVDVAEKIVARLHGLVHAFEVDAPGAVAFGGRGGGRVSGRERERGEQRHRGDQVSELHQGFSSPWFGAVL